MADDPITETESGILNATAEQTDDEAFAEAKPKKPKDYEPVYKQVGDSRIPTSKSHGKLWKSRRDAAKKKLEKLGMTENWDECIRYYKNDQSKTRRSSGDIENFRRARSTRVGTPSYLETENIVFANTSALVPSLYAKNPTCDVTPNIRDNDKDDKDSEFNMLSDRARVAKRLINALADQKATPGINLKPKARKAVIMTTLTNISYIEIGYTKRDDSSAAAMQNVIELTDKLKNASDQKEIMQIEGDLMALEQKVDILRPSGPFVKFRHPRDVLIDPDADEADGSDANWVMIADYVSTAFINAVYREKTKDDSGEDSWKSIYQPTHVIGVSDPEGIQEEINAFSVIGDKKDDHKDFGFSDEDTFKDAQRTKVWYVWDKVTRRVFMYNDSDWSWPIWVWDDPYNLDRFFPLYGLQFYTDPEDNIGPSEVMMYLDQQDAINSINGEVAKMRQRAIQNVFYNKNAVKDTAVVEKFLNGETNDAAMGVDMPLDTKINDVFYSALPPSAAYQELFKKDVVYASIDKLSSVTGVMQGQQFKTNTTNQAINTYNSQTQTRLDEKIDAVEDFIGDIMWGVMQMCLQFMPQDEVAAVLGDDDAQIWEQMDPDEVRKSFSIRITGGSLQKPTSQIKKAEAIQIGQVLGQYANAGGGAAIMIMIKALERAFDDIVITAEDWKTLEASVAANLQRGQSAGQGAPAQQGQPQEEQVSNGGTGVPIQPGQPPQAAPSGPQMPQNTSQDHAYIVHAITMFSKLPAPLQAAVLQMLQKGVPLPQIIQAVSKVLSGQPMEQPNQPQTGE